MPNYITGALRSIRYSKPEPGNNSVFLIAELESRDVIKGTFEIGEIKPGITYKWYGTWTQGNGKYPPSFMVQVAIPDTPHSREAIIEYLTRTLKGHNTGIGPQTAHLLFDAYGSEAVRELRSNPAKVAKKIKIDQEKAKVAAMVLERESKAEAIKIELFEIFKGKGFSKTTIKQCIDKWKSRAAAVIKRDAFALLVARISGAGFMRTDNLYMSLGGDPTALKRQMLCGWNALREQGGSTWHSMRLAIDEIRKKIGSVDTEPMRAIELGVRGKWLETACENAEINHEDRERHNIIAVGKQAENERVIARHLERLTSERPVFHWDCDVFTADGAITNHQAENLDQATRRNVGILAGTPGTGKTHTAASWLRWLLKEPYSCIEPGEIAVVAPTGKAAVRITEAMARYDLPIKACTIHRILLPSENGHGDGEWSFQANENNPLDYRLIVVDESSMIDTDLMAAFLRACRTGTQILFLGDPYQLPPVGHGAPLRDMIDAATANRETPSNETTGSPIQIGYGLLSEVQRNGGMIVDNCARIKAGHHPLSCERFNPPNGQNCRIVACGSSSSIITQLTRMYETIQAKGERDPVEDIQILVSLNEKSDLGREKLNKHIQGILNHNPPCESHPKFRLQDKVICLQNGNYPAENGGTVNVCNGEIGRVVESEESYVVLEFQDVGDGERLAKIPKAGDWAKSFDLGYAITVHKSQGSEWPIVVIVGDNGADRIASREWWYTAISRAKEKCLIFAANSTIARQIKRVTLHDRRTLLVEYLTGKREFRHAKTNQVSNSGKDSATCLPSTKAGTATVKSSWSEPSHHEIPATSPIL